MKTVGIIGGGQLGMMLALEIKLLGAKAICLDPNPKCPASYVCDVIVGNYDDINKLKKLGSISDVLTYEFENVPASALEMLNDEFNFKQGIKPLFDSQNRIREKNNALINGLSTPKFKAINSYQDLIAGVEEIKYPCIYKTTTLGYDGHGQVMLKSNDDLVKVVKYLDGEGILEEFINYDFETSIIMIRSEKSLISFPMTINVHKKGILDLVIADDKKSIFKKIEEQAKSFMENANYYGILTIEFFVKGNKFYFNEMAPRPHNSGHYTIEGCNTNQYKELAKFLLDEPLEQPILKCPTIMKNILGFDFSNIDKLPKNEDIHIHMYHKDKVLEKRKMGHVTFINTTLDDYNNKYKKIFCEVEDEQL